MAGPSVVCPLCKKVVKIVPHPGVTTVGVFSVTHHAPITDALMIEPHNWNGAIGDLVDRLLQQQWSARCPMSAAPAERHEPKRY